MLFPTQEPFQDGSYQHWSGAGPLSPPSAAPLTNSPKTIGVLWLKLTATSPWTNNAKHWKPRSTCLSRRYTQLGPSKASAKGGSKQHEQINMSTICDWGNQEPCQNTTESRMTWCTKGSNLSMDKDVHSDEGHGVTSLGYPGHLMTDAPL